jgi:sulfur-carrier protein
MKVVVRLASALRVHAEGAPRLELELPEPVTIAAVLDDIATAHPGVARRVRDETGTLRHHVNVFVGADSIRDLDGVTTVVPAGAEVALLPAVSGG